MNRKPLYQPWNEEQFLSDERVQVMNKMSVWMYRTLLCRAFFCSTRPYLPNDDTLLWALAGCESPRRWEKHEAQVLQMFKPVTVRGAKLLYQKRLTRDWRALQELRRTKSESGVKSGIARKRKKQEELQVNRCSTDVELPSNENEQVKVSKEKLSEGKGSEEMSLKKDVTIACLAVLGIKPSIDMNTSSELSSLEQAYPGKVYDDFRLWAEEQQGHQIAYPIQSYLKVAAGRLSGAILTEPSPSLQEFLDYVGGIAGSQITFNRAQLVALARLLEQYPLPDVKLGFQSFYNTLDEYSAKFAAKDFTEKGGQIVRNRVQARKRLEEQQATSIRLTEEGQAEVKQLNEEYAKKLREEEALAADAPEL